MKKTKLNNYRVTFNLVLSDNVKARGENEAKCEFIGRIADAIQSSSRIKDGFEWEIVTMNAEESPSKEIN